MNPLLIHPKVQRQLQAFMRQPSHALLLGGPPGSGKGTVAQHLAENILGLSDNKLLSYAYATWLRSSDGRAIGIEAVRELEQFLKLKVPSRQAFNRVVIIENAHLLTLEAQNALLKTLEEPPRGTLLILTTSYAQGLLPTIRSRAQTISLLAPSEEETRQYFHGQGFSDKDIMQALAISGGLTGLMTALLKDESHPFQAAVELARTLVGQSAYERLTTLDSLLKQRELLDHTLFILRQMAHVALQSAPPAAAKRWRTVLETAYTAEQELKQNAQPKLVLTDMLLKL